MLPVEAAGDAEAATYDAFVIGSAVYNGSWLDDAAAFVCRTHAALAQHPVWVFSSGPLGVVVKDSEPQPHELAEMRESVHPRDRRFF